MTNDIHTRPQGYQGPAFDNEQQRDEMQARARQIATTILNQIKAAPAAIWQSLSAGISDIGTTTALPSSSTGATNSRASKLSLTCCV